MVLEKMTSDAEIRINLAALQRRDPYIAKIVDSATQVALYIFNSTTREWEKTDIEGTLFVYSRLAPPKAGFTIMNRLSMQNLTEAVTDKLDFQNQSPFLLYRNAKLMIYGIWFYDMYDCSRIGKLLEDLSKDKQSTPVPSGLSSNNTQPVQSPNSNSSSSVSSISETAIDEEVLMNNVVPDDNNRTMLTHTESKQKSVDIMEILCKAKDDYDKNNNKNKALTQNSSTENGKPGLVSSDASKKLNVASLFGQSDLKKSDQAYRPSSADVFQSKDAENCLPLNNTAKSQSRNGSRSFSLSLSNEQFYSQHLHLINGTISVEELESPVLGMPARRARYHSSSENTMRITHSPQVPALEDAAPFQKLLGIKASSTKVNQLTTVTQTFSNPIPYKNVSACTTSSTNTETVNTIQQNNHLSSRTKLQRSQSIPCSFAEFSSDHGDVPVSNPLRSTTAAYSFNCPSTLSASLTPTMPTLHEHAADSLIKSKSVAAGLSRLPDAFVNSSIAVATANSSNNSLKEKEQLLLLPPHALQPTQSSTIQQYVSSVSSANSTAKSTSIAGSNAIHITSVPKPSVQSVSKTLISPEYFEQSPATPQKVMELRQKLLPEDTPTNQVCLDRNELATTLIMLLQNDESFVETVHKAYVSGLKRNGNYNKKNNASMIPVPSLWK